MGRIDMVEGGNTTSLMGNPGKRVVPIKRSVRYYHPHEFSWFLVIVLNFITIIKGNHKTNNYAN